MEFKVGDKVIAIEEGYYSRRADFDSLIVGKEYEIEKVNDNSVVLKDSELFTKRHKHQELNRSFAKSALKLKKSIEKETSSHALSIVVKNMIDSGTVEALGGKVEFSTDEYTVVIKKK